MTSPSTNNVRLLSPRWGIIVGAAGLLGVLAWGAMRYVEHNSARDETSSSTSSDKRPSTTTNAATSSSADSLEQLPTTPYIPTERETMVAGWTHRDDRDSVAWPEQITLPQEEADPVIAWSNAQFGAGHATPIVVDSTIYVTGVENEDTFNLAALDVNTGQLHWRKTLFQGEFANRHVKASDAASTPASDGRRIYVCFALRFAVELVAFDLSGEEAWRTSLGPCEASWGFASSLAYADGLLVINVDNPTGGFIAALHAENGETLWRRARPEASEGSYSSPVIVPSDSSPLVVIAGLGVVETYSLWTGERRSRHDDFTTVAAATPAVANRLIVACGGYPDRIVNVLELNEGLSDAKSLWTSRQASECPYVPSPLIHADRLYIVHDDGIALCQESRTGNVVWKRRLRGKFSASPLLLKDSLLACNEQGDLFEVALDDGKIRQTGSVSAGVLASPLIAAGRVLVRTERKLICIPINRSFASGK